MKTDIISVNSAKTLCGLFRQRLARSPHAVAYHAYNREHQSWDKLTWQNVATEISRWQFALEQENLNRGDRIGIMSQNCPQWVFVDQASLGLGMVLVPLYVNDRAENVAYILNNAGVKVLVIYGKDQWKQLQPVADQFPAVQRIISIEALENSTDTRTMSADDWLPAQGGTLREMEAKPDELASIVYTSGTTGNPKGVMLSHHNILWNAHAALATVTVHPHDLFLSFLPLSHMLERTVGYYLPMMAGAQIAYARSVPELGADMLSRKPSIIISVPRIFERIYAKIESQMKNAGALGKFLFRFTKQTGWAHFQHAQGRRSWTPRLLLWPLLKSSIAEKIMSKFGGRLRVTICGGAPLSSSVAELFIGVGLNILQGYGLTETSPIVCGNRLNDNDPNGVGLPLPGVEIKIGDNDELLVRSPGVMLGYWDNKKATRECIDEEGWFHTGDKARVENKHIYITGRIKEIIVLANGEKVPPADMEMAIASDTIFDQVMVIGESKPYLSAITILNNDEWKKLAPSLGLDAGDADALDNKKLTQALLSRIANTTKAFPGYAQVRRVVAQLEPWTVENNLITPTLKLRRNRILEHHKEHIDKLYQGH